MESFCSGRMEPTALSFLIRDWNHRLWEGCRHVASQCLAPDFLSMMRRETSERGWASRTTAIEFLWGWTMPIVMLLDSLSHPTSQVWQLLPGAENEMTRSPWAFKRMAPRPSSSQTATVTKA